MNDYLQLVKGRESIRNYDASRAVEKEILNAILEAGRMAPSAANYQPWRFILISSQPWLDAIRQCYQRPWFHEAPHVLVVAGNPEQAWKRADGYNSLETDLTIAMDHMILAAESLGIGTCWIANFDREILFKALHLEGSETVYAITPLGYQKTGFQKRGIKSRKAFEEVVNIL